MIKYEFKKLKNISILFTLVLTVLIIGLVIAYKPYVNNIDSVLDFFDRLPKKISYYLGISKEVTLTTIGYYSIIFKPILFIGAIYSFTVGYKSMVTDRKTNMNYMYFKTPYTKKNIWTKKVWCLLVIIIVHNIIFNIASIITLNIVKNDSIGIIKLFQINSSLLLIEVVFLSIGICLGQTVNDKYSIFFVTLITISIFLLLDILNITFNIKALSYINPFSYFKVTDIIQTGKYQYRFIVISVFIVVFTSNFSLRIYESRKAK